MLPVAALLLLGTLSHPVAQPDSTARPVAEVPRTASHISLNGDLSEWGDAAVIHFHQDRGRAERDNHVTVRLLWDADKLYVAFEVRDTQLHASRVRDDSDVWFDDAVEIFVDTRHDSRKVLDLSPGEFVAKGGWFDDGVRLFLDGNDSHITVNILGTTTTARGKGFNYRDSTWHAEVQRMIRLSGTVNDNSDVDSGYVAEIAIPWAPLGIKPRGGLRMGADFGVADIDGAHDATASDWCGLRLFNQPHRWGDMVLVESRKGKFSTSVALYTAASALALFALLGLVLSTIRCRRRAAPQLQIMHSRSRDLAEAAERYVKEHHGEPELSSAVVARNLFLSRRSLQMILKKEGKPPFRDMLTEVRLNRAEQLLLETDKTVGEIAFEVGFNSPDALSVMFRRRRGMSPSDFRRHRNI